MITVYHVDVITFVAGTTGLEKAEKVCAISAQFAAEHELTAGCPSPKLAQRGC
jgi:hypothetical protein